MRSIQPDLQQRPGELWIMIELPGRFFRDDQDRALANQITEFMESSALGSWNGQSSGAGSMDISFDVANLQASAQALDRFLDDTYTHLIYLICDHYEPRFDEPTVGTVECVAAILQNAEGHILFQQRDNKPEIAFPNYWALPGGHIEAGETPEAAIARELLEEIEYRGTLELFTVYVFWRSASVLVHQYVFTGTIDLPVEQIPLHEGQGLRFLNQQELDEYLIAFGYDRVCKAFLVK